MLYNIYRCWLAFHKLEVTSVVSKKDIAFVFILFASHKSVGLIEKSNNILQQVFKKIREFLKKWEDSCFMSYPKLILE